MQFKKVGKKIQVLAYRGYDKEKRRSIVQLLGTLDAYTLEPSTGLLDSLTVDEKIELQSYKENIKQQNKKQSNKTPDLQWKQYCFYCSRGKSQSTTTTSSAAH